VQTICSFPVARFTIVAISLAQATASPVIPGNAVAVLMTVITSPSFKDLDARREVIEVPCICEVCTLVAYLGYKNIQHTVRYTELSPMRFKNDRPVGDVTGRSARGSGRCAK
jgi:hypothetical protein